MFTTILQTAPLGSALMMATPLLLASVAGRFVYRISSAVIRCLRAYSSMIQPPSEEA